MADLANLSLVDAADAIRTKKANAVEVLQACLAELDTHGAAVNATIWIDREGAYSFAGLNMAEFAMNGTGHNRHCNNPWRLPYITGGSIRLPAAANGVSGIKATQTRTARDCARILSEIAGHDPMDPTSATVAVPDYEAGLDGDLRGLKVGAPTSYFLDAADAPVQAAFDAAMAVLVGRGAEIVPIDLPLMPEILTYGSILSRVEGATIHAEWMRNHPQDYAIHISARMFARYAVPGFSYVEAQSRRGPVLKAFAQDVFSKVHVLASPTIKVFLPTLAQTDVDAGAPDAMAKSTAVVSNTRPFNYIGLPVVSVPCGFDPNGLPISLSLAAKPFAEGMVLKVGDTYQNDSDWHLQRPGFKV